MHDRSERRVGSLERQEGDGNVGVVQRLSRGFRGFGVGVWTQQGGRRKRETPTRRYNNRTV